MADNHSETPDHSAAHGEPAAHAVAEHGAGAPPATLTIRWRQST